MSIGTLNYHRTGWVWQDGGSSSSTCSVGTWTDVTSAIPNGPPISVSSDSTGSKLYAAGTHPAISLNGGTSWTATDSLPAGTETFQAVSSSDGQTLAATLWVSFVLNSIRVSTNGGSTWSTTAIAGTTSNLAQISGGIAMSGDGTKIIVGDGKSSTVGYCYLSTNSGASFTQMTSAGTGSQWYVAISRDGSTIYISSDVVTSQFLRSTDNGVTWTSVALPVGFAGAVACGSDGTKVITADSNVGHIWTSTNSGASWTDRGLQPDGGFGVHSIAVSDDAQHVVFGPWENSPSSPIYISCDGGVTWHATSATTGTSLWWQSVSVAANGSQASAVDINGETWTSQPPAAPKGAFIPLFF